MYYRDLYAQNNKTQQQLFDVNKQISSGLKIQYAYEDTTAFSGTMRLDNEITGFEQIVKSVENGLKFSTQTDSTIGEFTKALDSFKVKLVQAASDVHSDASMEAIANELQGIRTHMMNLANTSINGQYLFAGTAVNTKPINADGTYNGNDGSMFANLGNEVRQAYNISGDSLFFGEESSTNRRITMNVPLFNQTELYPDIMKDPNIERSAAEELYITENDTIRDMMGDNDENFDAVNDKNYFFISGKRSDGTVFNEKLEISVGSTVADLLDIIGTHFGNSATGDVVDVKLNAHGQIEITDKRSGSSQLQFHMVGFNDDPDNLAAGDIDGLMRSGVPVKAFMDSQLESVRSTDIVSSFRDQFDQNLMHLPNTFYQSSGEFAVRASSLSDVFETDAPANSEFRMVFRGVDSEGNAVNTVSTPSTVATIQDIMTEIETAFGGAGSDIEVQLNQGKFVIVDNANNPSTVEISMQLQQVDTTALGEITGQKDPLNTDSVNINAVFYNVNGGFAAVTDDLGTIFDDADTPFVLTLDGTDNTGAAFGAAVTANVTTIDDILTEIENAYGAGVTASLVDGKIVVNDDPSNPDTAMVIQLSLTDSASNPIEAFGNSVEGFSADSFMSYEQIMMDREGNELTSNVPQIIRSTNAFAGLSTKLVDVSGLKADGSNLLLDTNGSTLALRGYDVFGRSLSLPTGDSVIAFDAAASTFSYNGNSYTVYDASGNTTPADEMTYQQLMDVVGMIMSQNPPAAAGTHTHPDGTPYTAFDEYNKAVQDSKNQVSVDLDHEGKLVVTDFYNSQTPMELSLDSNNDALMFNANNALTISDPKTNFFERIDEMIRSVRDGTLRADAYDGDPRNGGIQNSIQMLDDILEHVSKQQAKSGSQSQSLMITRDRTEMLTISAVKLRSETVDVDIAEASLRLQQLSLSMQAMLSTVAKVSQLSLVKYL
jgi:flagellin-like hook-associated protein FlgL